MRKLGYAFGTLLVLSCGAGVGEDSVGSTSTSGQENFAGGTQPLRLDAAPPGLCGGDGAQRECEDPAACEERDETASGTGGATAGADPTLNLNLDGVPDEYDYSPSGSGGASMGSGGYTAAGVGGSPGSGGSSGAGVGAAAGASGAPGGSTSVGGQSGESGGAGETGDAGRGGSDSAPIAGGQSGAAAAGLAGSDSPGLSPQALQPQAESLCLGIDSSTPYTLYLSADDSASTASATIARRIIRRGGTVPAYVVRPYEFLNYYDFSFEPADPGEVRIVPQLSSCPTDGELSLQVALQAEAREAADRAPLNIIFVLDTSGSMSGEPIALERAAVLAVAGELREGDIVSMVTWSTTQADILSGHTVSGPDDPVVVAAAEALSASGGTDLSAGLARGYALAEEHHAVDRINRVILVSDGQANVGITDEQLIAEHADDEEGGDAGIYLAGVGVGDGVNDTLMDTVTDAGRGAYVYLDSEAEARKIFGEHFLRVVDLAARAVRLEVTLPYYLEVIRFYGEEMSTDPTQVRPQHLGPNDAMVFFQILEACDPSLLHGDDRIRLRATWETPFTREARSAVIDSTLNDLAGDDANLTKAAAIAGYAEALMQVDKALTAAERLEIVLEALENVRGAHAADTDPDLVEVAGLLEQYATGFGG